MMFRCKSRFDIETEDYIEEDATQVTVQEADKQKEA